MTISKVSMGGVTFSDNPTYTFLTRCWGDTSTQIVVLETAGSEVALLPVGWTFKAAALPDKRVVVGGYSNDTEANLVHCFSAGTTTIDWTHHTPGYVLANWIDITVLTNGNIALVWTDYNDDYVYFKIIDSDGVEVVAETDVSGTESSLDSFIVALQDGGFAIMWTYFDSPYNRSYISIWNANGSNRVSSFEVQDGVSAGSTYSAIHQFSDNGRILFFSGKDDKSYTYNPTTGAEIDNAIFATIINQSARVHAARLYGWTDKFAMVYQYNDHTYGGIIKSDQTMEIQDKLVLSDSVAVDLIGVSNRRFLMLMYSTEAEGHYYILDSNLNIESGPHTAFTSGFGPSQATRGCVAY